MIDNTDFNAILDTYIKKDKINHAYLIETNSADRISLAYMLIEKILSVQNLNYSIDDLIINNDLLKICTESQVIKKEEIISIKDELMNKSVYSGYRFYIIEEAKKLNSSSANTLLKFLEEPDEGIIAILVTNNKYNIIETVLSRCQELRFYRNELDNGIELTYEAKIIDFILTLDKEKEKSIALVNKYFDKEMFERNNFQKILEEMLLIYYDILQKKAGLDIVYCKDSNDKIEQIAKENDYDSLNKKVISINNALDKMKINANTKLVLDMIILDSIGGVKNV